MLNGYVTKDAMQPHDILCQYYLMSWADASTHRQTYIHNKSFCTSVTYLLLLKENMLRVA